MTAGTHNSNFAFLAEYDERLAKIGSEAEELATISPTACMMQIRLLAELLARETAAYLGVYGVENTSFFETLRRLEGDPVFHGDIKEIFHDLRKSANDVAHGNLFLGDAVGVAIRYLKLVRKIAIWFHRSFGSDPSFSPGPFVDPPDLRSQKRTILAEKERLQQTITETDRALMQARQEALQNKKELISAEELLNKLQEERNIFQSMAEDYESRLVAIQAETKTQNQRARDERSERVREASEKFTLDEEETRAIIDAQLRRAHWKADSQNLRWANGTRPEAGQAMAIAEVPTSSGPADYVLFDGLMPVAIIEAKRRDQPIRSGLDQAKRYAGDISLQPDHLSPGGPWQIDEFTYKIPFVFAANGRDFHQQVKEHCGIYFQDLRRPINQARVLVGWYTPDGLRDLLATDTDAALEMLADEPFDYLGLRDYQREAIEAIEFSLRNGRREALLAMATGTGKTRTAIGMAYRMVKSGLFKRILFLVDRTSLGDQAFAAFQTTKLEHQRSFTETYDAKSLGESQIESDTTLSIATVQSMVYRLFEAPDEEKPPIDQFDCIIVDECHRGYNLDREMSETELNHRDMESYISKYRYVLDHFDAVIIGLTATPALHTTQIFRAPVYTYKYQTAVLEGHLVDQDPAIQITTKLSKEGLKYSPGQLIKIMDPKTGQIDFANTPDEIDFEIDSFNKSVITEGVNRAICQELARQIDPEEPGKTLVFCVDQRHAEMVERELKDAYADKGAPVTDNGIKIITGYTPDAAGWLRRYKNEKKPAIAITVDYLTTGIDVPEIVNLVFIRRVRSRILYEQMKGRATRLCPELNKTAFRIYDCVNLYEVLEDLTDMRPVVQTPHISMEQTYGELQNTDDPDFRSLAHRELLGKLNRRLPRLSDQGALAFEEAAGMSPTEFLQNLRDLDAEETAQWLADKSELIYQIPKLPLSKNGIIYDDTPDEVISVEEIELERDDYLQEFQAYVLAMKDSIQALRIVTQRPRELTRKDLLELRQTLARKGYRTETLQKAWAKKTNQDIAASIIGFVRQAALGEPLIPYETRVNEALKRLHQRHQWTEEQEKWLNRIAKNLIQDQNVADPDNLDHAPAFKQVGGFDQIDKKHFDGNLGPLLSELNREVWNTDEEREEEPA